MKYRIKEIKYTRYNGEEFSEWYIQIKYRYWPFWFTEQEYGYAGAFDKSFDSKESAENYLDKLIVETERRVICIGELT